MEIYNLGKRPMIAKTILKKNNRIGELITKLQDFKYLRQCGFGPRIKKMSNGQNEESRNQPTKSLNF